MINRITTILCSLLALAGIAIASNDHEDFERRKAFTERLTYWRQQQQDDSQSPFSTNRHRTQSTPVTRELKDSVDQTNPSKPKSPKKKSSSSIVRSSDKIISPILQKKLSGELESLIKARKQQADSQSPVSPDHNRKPVLPKLKFQDSPQPLDRGKSSSPTLGRQESSSAKSPKKKSSSSIFKRAKSPKAKESLSISLPSSPRNQELTGIQSPRVKQSPKEDVLELLKIAEPLYNDSYETLVLAENKENEKFSLVVDPAVADLKKAIETLKKILNEYENNRANKDELDKSHTEEVGWLKMTVNRAKKDIPNSILWAEGKETPSDNSFETMLEDAINLRNKHTHMIGIFRSQIEMLFKNAENKINKEIKEHLKDRVVQAQEHLDKRKEDVNMIEKDLILAIGNEDKFETINTKFNKKITKISDEIMQLDLYVQGGRINRKMQGKLNKISNQVMLEKEESSPGS